MTALHVVHVVCTDAFAGVERYVLSSALCLSAAGCRVTVVGGAESAMRDPLGHSGIDWLPGDTIPRALRSLRAVTRPDLFNTHMTLADMAGAIAGGWRGVPVVSTRHFASPRGGTRVTRLIARPAARRIAAQIAISEFVSGHVEGDNTVVYTGVADLEARNASRAPVVLVAQRLEAEKATDVALRAWARVSDRGEWRLRIAGEGAERQSLVALSARLGIEDSVDFLGFRSDLDLLLDDASLLIAPTPREGLGLSVIEAMAHGLPVIASRGGGHLETVGGVPGAALFDPGDTAEAARHLARLIADAEERRRYGAALRDRQRSVFNLASQTERTLGVFSVVADEGRN